MREVEVSAEFDVPARAIFDELTPTTIVESEGTFFVEDVVEADEGWLVTAVSREKGVEMEASVERLPDGYAYELERGGFFEELYTTLTVHDAEDGSGTRVTVRSDFTFGGRLAWLYDWLGAEDRKRELERTLATLAVELGEVEFPAD